MTKLLRNHIKSTGKKSSISAGLILLAALMSGKADAVYILYQFTVSFYHQIFGKYTVYIDDSGQCHRIVFVPVNTDNEDEFSAVIKSGLDQWQWLIDSCREEKTLPLLNAENEPHALEDQIALSMIPGHQLPASRKPKERTYQVGEKFTLKIHKYNTGRLSCDFIALSDVQNDYIVTLNAMRPSLTCSSVHTPPLVNGYEILNQLAFSFDSPVDIYRCLSSEKKPVAMELWRKSSDSMKAQVQIMESLTHAENSYSMNLLDHFPFQGEHCLYYVLIVELAEENISDWGTRFNINPSEHAFIHMLELMLEIPAFLDREGFQHHFIDYDFLLFNKQNRVKYCGHERTKQDSSPHNKASDVSSALKSSIGVVRQPHWMSARYYQFFEYINESPLLRASTILSGIRLLTSSREYIADQQASQLNEMLLQTYTTNLHSQLASVQLQSAPTPADGLCLLHAVLHHQSISVQQVISELHNQLPEDSVFATEALNDLELIQSEHWASPSLLPLLAGWLNQPIILLLPNNQNGDVIIQIYSPSGEAPATSSLQEAISITNGQVITHDGLGHFSATQTIPESHSLSQSSDLKSAISTQLTDIQQNDFPVVRPGVIAELLSTLLLYYLLASGQT